MVRASTAHDGMGRVLFFLCIYRERGRTRAMKKKKKLASSHCFCVDGKGFFVSSFLLLTFCSVTLQSRLICVRSTQRSCSRLGAVTPLCMYVCPGNPRKQTLAGDAAKNTDAHGGEATVTRIYSSRRDSLQYSSTWNNDVFFLVVGEQEPCEHCCCLARAARIRGNMIFFSSSVFI